MPRKKNEKADEAKLLYDSGQRLIDIAKTLNIPEGTVRRWKSTYKWDSERSERKANVHYNNTYCDKIQTQEDVEHVIKNNDLTDKQKLFCLYYVKYFNAAKAYMKAYDVSYNTACSAGCRLLSNVKIKEEIQRLKSERMNRELITEDDIFQKYIDIAFADISDYLEWREDDEPVVTAFGPAKDNNGNTIMQKVNKVHFKDSKNVDGSIISEIKTGKSTSIKLADRMKALDWLTQHMNLATEKEKAEIALIRAKIGDNDNTCEDDGFIEALKASAAKDWGDDDD